MLYLSNPYFDDIRVELNNFRVSDDNWVGRREMEEAGNQIVNYLNRFIGGSRGNQMGMAPGMNMNQNMNGGQNIQRFSQMNANQNMNAGMYGGMGVGMGAELSQGMAVVSIGGLAYATLLTLFLVPVLYNIFNRGEMKVIEVDFEDEE